MEIHVHNNNKNVHSAIHNSRFPIADSTSRHSNLCVLLSAIEMTLFSGNFRAKVLEINKFDLIFLH